MRFTLTPKVKLVGGALLTAGGVIAIYKAYNSESKNKFAQGVLGVLLLAGGLLLAKKGYAQNKSLKAMPMQELNKTQDDKVKEIIKEAVKEGKVSSASGVQEAPVEERTESKNYRSESRHQKTRGFEKGRVVGKVNPEIIDYSNSKKESIRNRISELRKEHDRVKKEKGWSAGLGIRNEIELLKGKLFWY